MSHTAFKGPEISRVIQIEVRAPAKPQLGEPCNGCGLCCLVAPCPLGMLLSRRRHGACAALRWDGGAAQYRCGALTQPGEVLRAALPHALRFFAPMLTGLLARASRRWIAAGQGCDSTLEAERPAHIADNEATAIETRHD